MNIKHKLTALFLALATIPMVLMGVVLYIAMTKVIMHSIQNELSALASVQQHRLEEVIRENKEHTRLITVRSDLVENISALREGKSENEKNAIREILDNTVETIDEAKHASIFSPDGTLLASSTKGEGEISDDTARILYLIECGLETIHVTVGTNNDLKERVYIAAPILKNTEIIGILIIVEDIRSLAEVTESYIGLGKSGETVLVRPDEVRNAVYITNRRFEDYSLSGKISSYDWKNEVAVQALQNDTQTYIDTEDYRGTPVIAASQYIYDTDWAVIVKIDKNEALKEMRLISTLFISVGILLLTLAFLSAWRYGLAIANPIEKLSEASRKMMEGKDEPIVIPNTQDEVALLCRTFEEMRTKVRSNETTLKAMVQEKTSELSGKIKDLERAYDAIEATSKELRKFMQAVDSSNDAIIMTLPDTTIVYTNPAWNRLSGYEQEEALGKHANIQKTEETPAVVHSEIRDAIRRGVQFSTDQLINARRDGTRYNAELTIYPITENGTVQYFVGIQRNITEHKRLETAKSEFLSLASHELGTPLSQIKWAFEIIMEEIGRFTETQQRLMRSAYSAVEQMGQAVNRMLMISKIEANAIRTDVSRCNVSQLMSEVSAAYSEEVKSKHLDLAIQCPADLVIGIDAMLLNEILSNLLKNAVNYTPENGNISINVHQSTHELLIEIRDNGIGIPYSEQSRIFEKLFRARNAVKMKAHGDGLGLYVCRSLVQLLGGTIRFESGEREGTTFTISFPASCILL